MDQTKLEAYLNRIYKNFRYCFACQPYDDEDRDIVWIFGDRIDLESYLYDLNIPEKMHEEIANNLKCPNCGSAQELYSDIGLRTAYEIEFEKKIAIIQHKYVQPISEFQKYLSKYPYLGMNHKIGKQIFKEIEKINQIEINHETWFRARTIGSSKVLTSKEMGAPSNKKVQISEGRYNHYGQSHLYLGKYQETCIKEICKDVHSICWMQEIEIIKLTNVLDISDTVHEDSIGSLPLIYAALMFSGSLIKTVQYNFSWKPEYFLPRFVADVAKSKGFSGIKYPSSISYGSNLVVFSATKRKYKYINEPFIYKGEKLKATDF